MAFKISDIERYKSYGVREWKFERIGVRKNKIRVAVGVEIQKVEVELQLKFTKLEWSCS